MNILDILTSPWAIRPDKLLEIQAIYATRLRGEQVDLEAVEKRLARPLANERQPYENRDGVAVIQLQGVIAKRMNMFTQISGGVSAELVAQDIAAAINDPAVHSLLLHIDSPGGTADGTQALARRVMAARDSGKQIVAYGDGVMASAAYWIGSAAQRVYIADGTTQVGSIGVVATHTDVSRMEEKAGVKTTEIYAGQYKRIASSYAPLTKEGKQAIQDQVDYLYSIFVADVAAQRGVAVETVLKSMADGRVFIGQQALAAGLVDGVSTLGALVATLNRSRLQGGLGPALSPNVCAAISTVAAVALTEDQSAPEHLDGEALEYSIRSAFDSDPKIQAEFRTFEAYAAYRRADAAGKIRVFGRRR